MTQKQFYESPSAELLVVRFEGNFCASYGVAGAAGAVMADDDDYEYTL